MASGSEEGLGSGIQIDEYESLISTTDVELLKRAWRHEKAAPEILQFETALVQRTREQIQLMEETVEEFAESGTDPLTVSLYQMDLDRTQFLLRSYLRIRLQKIEKYMIHISKTELWNRLSTQEQKFAKRCTDDMGKHLEQSVLSRLPDGYKSILKQSTASEEDDMGESYGAVVRQIPELYGQLNSAHLERIASLDAHTCRIKCVIWWPSGRNDKLISIDEENLFLWSLDSSRKAAQVQSQESAGMLHSLSGGAWDPHDVNAVATTCESSIQFWDLRTMRRNPNPTQSTSRRHHLHLALPPPPTPPPPPLHATSLHSRRNRTRNKGF